MTITTEDPRTAKALAALEHCGQWLKVRDTSGRAIAYGIPSATTLGLYHFANSTQCTCPDHARFGNHCWHSRAVAMHVAALKAQPKPKQAKAAPVLEMIRHAGGELSWDRVARPGAPLAPAAPSPDHRSSRTNWSASGVSFSPCRHANLLQWRDKYQSNDERFRGARSTCDD